MATESFHHGIRVFEEGQASTELRVPSTSVIGMVVTASDADTGFYPLDTPVLVTDIRRGLDKAGSLGTLAPSLDAIRQQCSPAMVIVRVGEGEGATTEEREASQTSKVVGSYAGGVRTGMQALLSAQAKLRVRPKILGAPGLDAKPVAEELAVLAKKLRGMSYVSAYGAEDISEALLYQNGFGQRETMVIWPDCEKWSTVSNSNVVAPATAYALGLRSRIDIETGWHKSLSNVPLNGVTGVSKDVYFDLEAVDTDADILNAGNVTTLIEQKGYRLWGNRTCSTDANFAFETATRTANAIAEMMIESHFNFVDKPFHPSLIKDMMESINAKFRDMTASKVILGGSCWLDMSVNTVNNLKIGRFRLDYDYTPVPPLEDLGFIQRITDKYFGDFAQRVATGN